jgi:ABC-2 type transport system permease protein
MRWSAMPEFGGRDRVRPPRPRGRALIDGSRLIVERSRSGPAVSVVQDAVAAHGAFNRLRALGLTQPQALETLAPRPRPIDALERPTSDADQALLYAGILALFAALAGYGTAVAAGVTEEKSSRVVELLHDPVAAPPAHRQGARHRRPGVARLTVTGGAALAAGRLAGGAGLPAGAAGTVATVVLWFLLGYAFYSVAFAAVGALVSRQEDLSAAMYPIVAVLAGSFLLSLAALDFGRTRMEHWRRSPPWSRRRRR